jgi:catechol 2,3-dioxygenase-like lactoylglutathione lyase family enzyme
MNTPRFTLSTVVLDCQDANALADFYSRLLGWDVTFAEPGWVLMRSPDGGTGLAFQSEAWYQPPVWPEVDGQPTKMLHLDIRVDDLEAAVAHAVAAGARLADHQPQEDVRVLLDPAGHPFCLFLH